MTYKAQAKRLEKMSGFKAVDTKKLTLKRLRHRKGKKLIVERIIGKVVDNKGNGRVIGSKGYIKYPKRFHYKKGDVVVTYCFYNPKSNYVDDIIDRWDWNLTNNPINFKK